MSEIVPVSRGHDFSGLRLTQSATGHVHSPWFSFHIPMTGAIYSIGSQYHDVLNQSKEAFASILGIKARDVVVMERQHHSHVIGDREWRLGTPRPMQLPQVRKTPRELPENQGAIDI